MSFSRWFYRALLNRTSASPWWRWRGHAHQTSRTCCWSARMCSPFVCLPGVHEEHHLTIHSDMTAVVTAMANPESGLEVRDRMWLKITIANAFIGEKLHPHWRLEAQDFLAKHAPHRKSFSRGGNTNQRWRRGCLYFFRGKEIWPAGHPRRVQTGSLSQQAANSRRHDTTTHIPHRGRKHTQQSTAQGQNAVTFLANSRWQQSPNNDRAGRLTVVGATPGGLVLS